MREAEADEMKERGQGRGRKAIAFRRTFSMKENDDDAQIIFPLSTQTSHRLRATKFNATAKQELPAASEHIAQHTSLSIRTECSKGRREGRGRTSRIL